MAVSAKALKLRIKSVHSIQRITKTMKMVAASKLKGFQTRMEASRPLVSAVDTIQNKFLANAEGEAAAENAGSEVFVAMSSDRGLCGGVNSAVVKAVRNDVRDNNKTDFQIVTIGDKARSALARMFPQQMRLQVTEAGKKPPTFLQASLLAEQISAVDGANMTMCYNVFQSAIAYETQKVALPSRALFQKAGPQVAAEYELEYESDDVILDDLYEFVLTSKLFNGLLETSTCEQSARMTAMDGASKNCGELISRLTTQMNRARQAAITTELCEIVAGAEAISQ
jgi:F-type H+-transporting ATPase subunit gamma